ncbi:phosphodiester glycosidase family protein [Chryseobacterium sp. Mn2064]|uniref:phosphodiester glycosidase family protein n=1 Tax=Chryseobacterium sp. Mn2064 TaxID=3395263 RepID=UPI003BD8C04F
MIKTILNIFLPFLLLFCTCCKEKITYEDDFVIFKTDPQKENIKFYWKNTNHTILGSIGHLKKEIETRNEKLLFAMNGGMFEPDSSPKGLYIENFKILKPIDTARQGSGNFYLPPNGIFYLARNHKAGITVTQNYRQNNDIQYATQSGPMLLMNGTINPIFNKDSKNLNIRNGVGILENGEVVFVMSKKEVNFYNFARLFKELGCKDALYLDGYVSRAYLPEKNWIQTDGNFGVIIGVSKTEK